MTRKREPVAYVGAEDYRLVKFTHDVELATELMRRELTAYYGCPRDPQQGGCPLLAPVKDCPHGDEHKVGKPETTYVRQIYALDSSYAAAEGWAFSLHEYPTPGRGAFPAVVFRV